MSVEKEKMVRRRKKQQALKYFRSRIDHVNQLVVSTHLPKPSQSKRRRPI